jgi:hypothetical protein
LGQKNTVKRNIDMADLELLVKILQSMKDLADVG